MSPLHLMSHLSCCSLDGEEDGYTEWRQAETRVTVELQGEQQHCEASDGKNMLVFQSRRHLIV